MKRIFLFLASILISTTAFATTNTSVENSTANQFVRGYGNSFIFVEGGIEFSVFADGQFDFYMPNYGPDVSVGINTPGFSLSFNTGFNYNPYVQYDDYGAVVQIENVPIFYDHYGRIIQAGNIFINYNGFGYVNRVGGLYVHYRNRVFSHCTGFINSFNTAYIYRPWHRFYVVPPVNYCVVYAQPYRRFYRPVRHIYYRPYTNNVRYSYINGRRGDTNRFSYRRGTSQRSSRYAQTPRNERERNIRRTVERQRVRSVRNNNGLASTSTRTRSDIRTNRGRNDAGVRNGNTTRTRSNTRTVRDRNDATVRNNSTRVRTNRNANGSKVRTKTTRTQVKAPKSQTKTRKSVTRSQTRVSKSTKRNNTQVRKPNASKKRTYTKRTPQRNQRKAVTQSKRKTSSARSSRSSSKRSRSRS